MLNNTENKWNILYDRLANNSNHDLIESLDMLCIDLKKLNFICKPKETSKNDVRFRHSKNLTNYSYSVIINTSVPWILFYFREPIIKKYGSLDGLYNFLTTHFAPEEQILNKSKLTKTDKNTSKKEVHIKICTVDDVKKIINIIEILEC